MVFKENIHACLKGFINFLPSKKDIKYYLGEIPREWDGWGQQNFGLGP